MKLLRKPFNIKRLKIKYSIKYEYGSEEKIIIKEINDFCYDKHSNGYWLQKLSTQTDKAQRKYSLQFRIKINILDIFDRNDKHIKPREWHKWNITIEAVII